MKISVIVPIYNMEKFIARAIDFLKQQDDPDIEFILVNDGSTDVTLSIMESLCNNDDRFRIFSISNKGYGYACNFGIQKAIGDFVAIYEPDDCITSDFYSNLRCAAERFRQADVIRYNGIYYNENNKLKRLYCWEKQFTGKIIDKYTLKRFWRSHPSVFNGIYRKDFLIQKNIIFCESPSSSFQDTMFMVSLFYGNPTIYIINDVKYIYSIHDMQSIQFVDDKIDFVIESWKMEKEWLQSNSIYDINFFIYKVFTQFMRLSQKASFNNKKKLHKEFKRIVQGNIYLNDSISTLKHKIQYALTW